MNLKNIRLGYSPLTDSIFLYRCGKDPALALEKRKAEADVMSVLVQYMMNESPRGSEKDVTLGNKKYTIRVVPAKD